MSDRRDFLVALNRNLTDSTALSGTLPANLRSAANVYSKSQVDSLLGDLDDEIGTATQAALDLKAPKANPTFTGTVSGVTKSMVGLGNVDNTSDANKPISSATQTALDGKATTAQGAKADTALQSVVQGTGITVDNTDPLNPVINASGGGGSGDVVGPASSTAGHFASYDDTTGKLLEDSGVSASSFQAASSKLTDIVGLAVTDSNIIVGNGTTWVAESGATARTSLGVGTGDSPQFTAINLGHASDTTITRVSSGLIAVEGSNVLMAGTENQAVTGGATVTSKSLGTQSSGTLTLDLGDCALQHYTNGGAHTLAPGSVTSSAIIDITNNGSAGAITTSGWTKVAGDSFTTTNAHKFRCHCSVGNGGSLLVVQALQ